MQEQTKSEESPEPFKHSLPPGATDVDARPGVHVFLDDLQDAVDELISEPGSFDESNAYNVDVSMDGKWCVLEGTVDSQMTRAAIFSLIPDRDGRRFIVDRLQVTYD